MKGIEPSFGPRANLRAQELERGELSATNYVDCSATFTASAVNQTLTFNGTDLNGGDNTVFIDNVRVMPWVPSPWSTADIGAVGSANYLSGKFTIAGSGADIWGRSDEFRFVYQLASGDCDIRTRVASLQNTHNNVKAGVMIRGSLNANSAHAMVNVTPGRRSGIHSAREYGRQLGERAEFRIDPRQRQSWSTTCASRRGCRRRGTLADIGTVAAAGSASYANALRWSQ